MKKELGVIKRMRKITVLVMMSLLLSLSSQGMQAMHVYADESNPVFVSSSGDDTNGDGTEANPYATLQKAYEESNVGGDIILLSDIDQTGPIAVTKSITLSSKEGQGPFTIKRASAFDESMFAVSTGNGPVVLSLENIVLDDNFITASGRKQDGIITSNFGNNALDIVLGNGTTLKNYGGNSAVLIRGAMSTLTMKSGSLITTGGTRVTGGWGAVWNDGATFRMESGATIDNVSVSSGYGGAVISRYGTTVIDGTISNCRNSSGDYAIINFAGGTNEIGPNAKIYGNTSKHGTIYTADGAVLTVRGEIYNNTTDAADTWASAIYASDNNKPSYVYIEEGAYIHNNTHYAGGITPYGTALIANNTSQIIMNGGTIENNTTMSAVMVRQSGRFTMNGGTISGHSIGVHIENRNAIREGRLILNSGTISNTTDICIINSTQGFLNGSHVYLSEDMISKALKVSSERIDSSTFFIFTYYYRTLIKTIAVDPSMKETYLGNASSDGIAKLNAVQEVSDGMADTSGNKLMATWFGASADDNFKLTVSDIDVSNFGTIGDVYVCFMPVDENGNALDGGASYKIVPCDKTISSGKMSITFNSNGMDNANGYAFGVFANPALAEKTYTLHYDSKGGGDFESKTNIAFDDANLLPSTEPSIEGKRFIGWYQDEALTRECTNTTKYSDIVENDITKDEATIYAKYETITYTVEFDSDGGTPVDAQTVEHGSKATKPKDPTKSGYGFDGWCLGDEEFDFDSAIKANVQLKAKWRLNTGDIKITKKVAGDNPYSNKEFDFYITLLDSQLEPIANETFDTDTDPVTTSPDGKINLKMKHNESRTIKGIPEGVRYTILEENYTNDGYEQVVFKDANGNTVALDDPTNNLIENGKTASFTAINTMRIYDVVVSDDGNGTASANPTSGIVRTNVTITATPNDGYVFDRWEVVSGEVILDNPSNATTTFSIGNSDVEVKAIFKAISEQTEYTITYDLNGGEYNGNKKNIMESYKAGTKIKIHAAPTREGYNFLYWKGSEYQPGDEYIVTENHTLVAQWEKNTGTDNQKSVDTGVKTNLMSLLVLLFASGGTLAVVENKRRNK